MIAFNLAANNPASSGPATSPARGPIDSVEGPTRRTSVPSNLARQLAERTAEAFGKLHRANFDASLEHPCEECGRVCERVMPGAYACAGPRHEGQCVECVGFVPLTAPDVVSGRRHCRVSRYHVVTNIRRAARG